MGPDFDMPPFMKIAFAVFAVLFVVVLVVVATGIVRSRTVLRESGLDPLSAQAQLAARLAQGPLGTPAQSLEQRLAELDDLQRRGLITAEEHAEGRRAALTQ
jgi:lipopolysaccharide export LptBFGC system permease protein LptF